MSRRPPWNLDALLFGVTRSRARHAPLSRSMLAAALPTLGLPLAAGTPVILGAGDSALLRTAFLTGLVALPFFPLAVIALRLGVRSGRIGCVPMLAAGAVTGALALPAIVIFALGARFGKAAALLTADLLGLVIAMLGAATFGMAYAALVWAVFFALNSALFRAPAQPPHN